MSQFAAGRYGPLPSPFQVSSPMAMTMQADDHVPQLPGAADLPDTDGSLVGKAVHFRLPEDRDPPVNSTEAVSSAEVTPEDFAVTRRSSGPVTTTPVLAEAPTEASSQSLMADPAIAQPQPQPQPGSSFNCYPSVFTGLGYCGLLGAPLAGSIACCATSVPLGFAIFGYGELASGGALVAGGTSDAVSLCYQDHCPVSARYEPEDHPLSTCAGGTFLAGVGGTVLGILGLTPGSVYCAFSLPCAVCLAMFGCTERTPYRCA